MAGSISHEYTNELQWTGEKKGALLADGLPSLAVATPPEFNGHAGFWSPEQLYVASANACVMATFLAIAENSKLNFVRYSASATGKLEKSDAGLQVTEILIRAHVDVSAEKDKERAMRVLSKAEENCLISRSMKTPVSLEPTIDVVA